MTLEEFFHANKKVAIAFSGGVDSSFLLYSAKKYSESVTAYYIKTQFQPQHEFNDAIMLANELSVRLKVLPLNILSQTEVTNNDKQRCYFCKKTLFTAICEEAKKDGYTAVLDGTNASDDEGDRPGIRALREMRVLSPLKDCGLNKEDIRTLSKEAGLFTWNKPAYACLATRIPTGVQLTEDRLIRTEKAEDFLSSLGFVDFRVRQIGNSAKIQIKAEQFSLLLARKEEIVEKLKNYYDCVLLDMEGR